MNSCSKCLEQSEWYYQQQLGNIYDKMDGFEHAFQNISLDPLGYMEVKAFNKSRKIVEVWPLLIGCVDTGAILCPFMESTETRSVVKHF